MQSRGNHCYHKRREEGFSNQQALVVLIIAFPLGLIGLGLVLNVAMKPSAQTIAEVPTENNARDEAPSVAYEPEPEPLVPAIKPTATRTKPLANDSSYRKNAANNCWLQMHSGGRLSGNRCAINSRVNVNGDRVFDVIEHSGLKRAVVLWNNDQAEVFLQGNRYTGNWRKDSDGDVRVTVGGGTFAFTPPS